jgi:NAD(P)-dependent dehydrogenase (short-subunit alcohol dehydrogenase family)
MERVLITGANRGIGLGMVQAYLERDDVHIFATCRHPAQANDLKKLASAHPEQLTIIQLELSDDASIKTTLDTVQDHVSGLDVLINNAAMRFTDEQEHFGAIKTEEFLYSMHINAVAPLMFVQTFVELLKAGNNTRIANVTTGPLVPVEYNLPYNYCISKAALNMITRYLAVNLAEFGIISIGLYPGWVQTEMGYSGGGKPTLTIAESGKGCVEVISSLTMRDNEQFIAWNGRVLSALHW